MSFRHMNHRHDNVAEARECEAQDWDAHMEQQAELATEQRYERWLEDGGAHAAVIQHEHQEDERRVFEHGPETPCRCGTYDRCLYQRQRDAARAPTHNAAIRALHRAYND